MELVASIRFTDDSQLFIRDYLFDGKEKKYSFHWQDKERNLIIRWDNQPHWEKIRTFPHHKHKDGEVLESKEYTLEKVLDVIAKSIGGQMGSQM